MNRRGFLRSFFTSSATIVVAPAYVIDQLHEMLRAPKTYVDMGRNSPLLGMQGEWVAAPRPVSEILETAMVYVLGFYGGDRMAGY